MKDYNGRTLTRNVRRLFCSILTTDGKTSAETSKGKEIVRNSHLIRSCCLNILNVQKEFSECSLSENNIPVIFEEIQDFCEISNYALTEDSITAFCRKFSQRRNLSYAEIACLIPIMEYCCLLTLEDLLRSQNNSVKVLMHSLHILNSYDCSALVKTLSKTEDVLNRDDVFPYLDEPTKNLYRVKLRKLAQKSGKPEREVAVDLLKKARIYTNGAKKQIGYHLFHEKKNHFYFPVFILIALVFSLVSYLCLKNIILFLLSLIPILISAKLLCDTIFSRILKPELLPKIKITNKNCPLTLVTVVSLISNKADAEKLLHRLDVLSHRITIPAIRIGLLLDLPASDMAMSKEDKHLLSFLESEINRRNELSDRFFCAVRSRKWVADKYRFEAFGRKQGAIMEFCDLVEGSGTSFSLAVGNMKAEYLVTLDADTEPTPGSVESMIGFMEHPNHLPQIERDAKGFSYVKSGYGAAAPRVEANPETSFSTFYSAMMSGNSGTEFYKNPHFNLYQDLFSEGIFCGKGIFRISLYKELISNRFRCDPILSHDLPEGEILRCANLSDLVFFDEIPDTVLADEKRTHRWIRGDFQNAVFLFPGKTTSWLFRFKIFHNLIRALFPSACFLLIFSSVFLGIKGLIAALFWLIFPLILRLPFLFSSLFGKVRRYHPFREFFDAIAESVFNILLLPTRAVNGTDAAIRGTVRQICGTKKLEWTTAASAARTGKEIGDYFYQLRWQQLGFLLVFFPQTVLIGALWMIGPVIARQISMPYGKDHANTGELYEELKSMWQYYEDLMNEKSHWLPPDNYQQEPLNVIAQRTSPTNIGLALLSVLGAYDLNFIDEEELYIRIENTLDTVESLPKWKGHLYNWYDTQTLKILPPKFISTVDCGNCAASLYTLSQGLSALKTDRSKAIVRRISALLIAADFSVLYDEKKKLFPIGYHVDEERMSSSYYDLYASEARLTSYYAIMRHQIPGDHWAHLARPTSKDHDSLILSSWSGTMFEYFMPHLFLPAYRRTLSGEALRGIITAQKRYADKRIPWGISESCYYTFDSLLNYQYRAFGIPAAALRRDLSFPQVISPYSTFLVYPWFPTLAEKNKKLLAKGKYGYYEAIDYRSGVDNPRVVQCYMAHHVGMSFLSGVNILTDRIMQKRFMTGEGEAYSSLLAERIPAYSKNYFPDYTRDRERWQPTEIRIDRPDPEHPKVRLLSNGKLTEILTDSGAGVLREKDRDLTKYSADPQSPAGVFLFIRNKGTLYGATYAPLYQDKNYRMFYDGTGATCYGSFTEFETRMTITMVPDLPVSVRELTVKNNLMTENSFEFFLFAEPVLCNRREYNAHPEYKDLFLTAEYDPSLRTISFCRRSKDELWFSVTASEPFQFDVCRDHFGEISNIAACKMEGICRYPIFPTLVLRGNLGVRGRGTKTVRFYFSTGRTKKESTDRLRRATAQNVESVQRRYAQSFDALCYATNIRSADRLIFDQIASRILMPITKSAAEAKAGNTLPLKTLWKYGISGDAPIFTVRIGKDSVARVLPFVKSLFLMTYAGIPADLILLYREEEGYQTPMKTALDAVLEEIEDNVRVRIFPLNIQTVDEYLLIQKCSRLFINLERGWKLKNSNRTFRPIRAGGTPRSIEKLQLPLGRGGYNKDRAFMIPKVGREPLRPWNLVLANHKFGTVLTERSLGYTFAENASENRITPRIPGVGYQLSGELYYAVIRRKHYDLLKNASVEFRTNCAIYRIDLFGYKITTKVFVPKQFAAKIITVTIETELSVFPEIVYKPQIILGKESLGTVSSYTEEDKIFFRNACNNFYGTGHAVLFGIGVSTDENSLKFSPDGENKCATFVLAYGAGPNSAREIATLLSKPGRIGREAKLLENREKKFIEVDTPDKEFNGFLNGFLQHQIISSRILGRTGPSQPGGAYGFRDQLQDSLCIATFAPAYLKRQILRCCAHQFEEGDVLHWWHPRRNRNDDGIRTRFSDDPFWLVYACTEYLKITDDRPFFQKKVAYLAASPLNESETDRYFTPALSEQKESVYHHALRAIRYGIKLGQHGFIRFGSGDWNDGMNRIEEGGETVWGTMFALLCVERFLVLAEIFGNDEEILELKNNSAILRSALNNHSFTNGRYLRGYRADGTPFGGDDTVDLIPQAFAAFCNLDSKQVDTALDLAYHRLWDSKYQLIKLLTPPYRPQKDGFPGSIADYPPGVRENGGQYTHAAVWFARAMFQRKKTELAWEILSGINPVSLSKTPAAVSRYGAEPYVLAADVYTQSGREGFGGWTHYTGAAGWYLKTVTEDLLGIHREGRRVYIRPNLPKKWNGYGAELQIEEDVLRIRVECGTETGCYEGHNKIPYVTLNGTEHKITVIV